MMHKNVRDLVLERLISSIIVLSIMVAIIGVINKLYGFFRAFDLLIGLPILIIEICVFLHISKKPQNDKQIIIRIIATSVLLCGLWNIVYHAQPTSDYAVLWEGGEQILEGSFYQRVKDPSDYFYYYNYQIPYAFYLAILMRLLLGSLDAIKCVQLVIMTLTNVVLFKTLRLYFSTRKAYFSTLLFVGYPYIFMGSGILNNQHEGLFLISLAVYCFLSSDAYRNYFVCAMLLSAGNMFRPTATVVLLVMALSTCIFGIVYRKGQYFVGALILIIVFSAVNSAINGLFIFFELAPRGVKAENLWFKLLLGLTGQGITGKATTDAIHTNLYYDLLSFDFDYMLYQAAAKEHLISLIRSGSLDWKWIIRTFLDFLGGVDNQVYYGDSHFTSRHWMIVNVLNIIGAGIYTLSLCGSLATGIQKKKSRSNPLSMIGSLIFTGYFFAYFFLEKQTRYRYEQYYALFLLGVPALFDFFQKMVYIIKRKMNK